MARNTKIYGIIGILIALGLIFGIFYLVSIQQTALTTKECPYSDISSICTEKSQCINSMKSKGAPDSFFNEIDIKCENAKCELKLLNGKC